MMVNYAVVFQIVLAAVLATNLLTMWMNAQNQPNLEINGGATQIANITKKFGMRMSYKKNCQRKKVYFD
jgi:hypothetical protein